MREWVIVLVYSIALITYIAIHQIIFRYRFKELAFTIFFLVSIFFVSMLATRFNSTVTWLLMVSLIIMVLYAIYVSIIMRALRDKIQKQVLSGMNLQDMIKSMLSGELSDGAADIFKSDKGKEKNGDIVANEQEEEEKKEENKKNYDVGDIIIDDKHENDENKKDE